MAVKVSGNFYVTFKIYLTFKSSFNKEYCKIILGGPIIRTRMSGQVYLVKLYGN